MCWEGLLASPGISKSHTRLSTDGTVGLEASGVWRNGACQPKDPFLCAEPPNSGAVKHSLVTVGRNVVSAV